MHAIQLHHLISDIWTFLLFCTLLQKAISYTGTSCQNAIVRMSLHILAFQRLMLLSIDQNLKIKALEGAELQMGHTTDKTKEI